MRSSICRIPVAILALGAFLSAEADAQRQISYLQLSPTVKAVLYSPPPGSTSRVAAWEPMVLILSARLASSCTFFVLFAVDSNQ